MGREIKRVAKDFNWLLKKVWKGYLNPYYRFSAQCPFCNGTGLNPETKKLHLLLAKYIQKGIKDTNTWLSARMVKNAFAEGYGMVQSAKSNVTDKKPYCRPWHYSKKAILSETINTQFDVIKTKEFDFNVTLGSLGNKLNISIPLKKHKQFNKWNELGKRSKSIVLTKNYIMFSFEIETGKKKEESKYLGVDIGLQKLIATSDNSFIGEQIYDKLKELKVKQRCSKGYYRKKEEIKEYINLMLKQIPWHSISHLVCEKLKGIKYRMKERKRLSKNMRGFISNWNYAQVLGRIKALCQEMNVSFRSVPAYYTSVICPICGHRDKGNRKSQEIFECQKCGHSDNADINAAKNILIRFLTGAYGPCCKQNELVKFLQV